MDSLSQAEYFQWFFKQDVPRFCEGGIYCIGIECIRKKMSAGVPGMCGGRDEIAVLVGCGLNDEE